MAKHPVSSKITCHGFDFLLKGPWSSWKYKQKQQSLYNKYNTYHNNIIPYCIIPSKQLSLLCKAVSLFLSSPVYGNEEHRVHTTAIHLICVPVVSEKGCCCPLSVKYLSVLLPLTTTTRKMPQTERLHP